MSKPKFTVNILSVARKAILKMPQALQEQIFYDLDDLAVFGNELHEPKVRDLGNGLKELRTQSASGIGRSFFFFYIEKQIFVVHALHKKTQKTPKQDLDLAKTRMKQLKNQLKEQ